MILPMIDVPVSLFGALAVMYAAGFSLNNLTLFGLVLAIGIVVDDAIVVLENVERWIAKGFERPQATLKAMTEITGPIVAITIVLSSVFLPQPLLGGVTGQFFRQFALTISAAMMISAVNAMTLTPSRAAAIFRGHEQGTEHVTETLPRWGWSAPGRLWFLPLAHRTVPWAAAGAANDARRLPTTQRTFNSGRSGSPRTYSTWLPAS